MFEARWEIYTNKKMGYTKINNQYFGDVQKAIDFLRKKKEKIKTGNWISGTVVETQYIYHLEI